MTGSPFVSAQGPPYSIHSERVVVSSLVADPQFIPSIAEILDEIPPPVPPEQVEVPDTPEGGGPPPSGGGPIESDLRPPVDDRPQPPGPPAFSQRDTDYEYIPTEATVPASEVIEDGPEDQQASIRGMLESYVEPQMTAIESKINAHEALRMCLASGN